MKIESAQNVPMKKTLKILFKASISVLAGNSAFLVRNSANMAPTDHMSIGVLYNYAEERGLWG